MLKLTVCVGLAIGLTGCAINSDQVRMSEPTASKEYPAEAKALSDCLFQDLSAAEPDFPHRRFHDAQGFHVEKQLSDASEHPDQDVVLDVLVVPAGTGSLVEVRSFKDIWGGHVGEPNALWQMIDRCASTEKAGV